MDVMKSTTRSNIYRLCMWLASFMVLGLGACSTEMASLTANEDAAKPATIVQKTTPLPHISLYAYTHAHALNPNPPDRWGGNRVRLF